MVAFDLFESDKDQENLLDTLIGIVKRYKKVRCNFSLKTITLKDYYHQAQHLLNNQQLK